MKQAKFNIQQHIYHATPSSYGWGIVLDRRYYPESKRWEYYVVFSPESESLWYYEEELSSDKVII